MNKPKKSLSTSFKYVIIFVIILLGVAYNYTNKKYTQQEYIDYNYWLTIEEDSLSEVSEKVYVSFKTTNDLYKDTYTIKVKLDNTIYYSTLIVENNLITEKLINIDSHIHNELPLGSIIKQDFKNDNIQYLD